MKELFFSGCLLIALLSTEFSLAQSKDRPQALIREFHMHAENSTVAFPVCLFVRQKLLSFDAYRDEQGNVSNVPVFRTDFQPATCTHNAFPFEPKPGLGIDTRITSEAAPWLTL